MYQEVCFNRGTEAGEGGGVNVGQSLSPSSHFMLATGLQGVTVNSVSILFSWHKNLGRVIKRHSLDSMKKS